MVVKRKMFLFCFLCFLFSTSKNREMVWVDGASVRDVNNLETKIKRHAISKFHLDNDVKLNNLGNESNVLIFPL